MDARDFWQEEFMDISLALEEEALVLALFGQSISEKTVFPHQKRYRPAFYTA